MARSLSLCVSLGAVLARGHGLEDASVLVQAAVQTHVAEGAAVHAAAASRLEGRMGMLAGLAAKHREAMAQGPQQPGAAQQHLLPSFDCSAYPFMCQAPFNCHKVTPFDTARNFFSMATPDGHANLQGWCSDTRYVDSIAAKCLRDKDLKASARLVFQETHTGKFGANTAEMDGSYCFIEGHCSNTAVTENTTLEEAEAMCDHRFGHEGWTKFGVKDIVTPAMFARGIANLRDEHRGFNNAATPKMFLKAACAMGNYHCDVVYCKETYCREPYYLKKYGHLLPKVPGHLIQQRDWIE